MKSLLGVALILCSCVALSFASDLGAQPQAVSKDGLSSVLADSLGCSSFRWFNMNGLPEKTALMVPVILEGREYWFQLDTGSDRTFIYGSQAKDRGWKTLFANVVRVPNDAIAGVKFSALEVGARPEIQASEQRQGTVGLDLLVGYMVVLDFPGKHFCVFPRADFPAVLGPKASWIPAEIRGGKLHIDVSVSGERLDVFYDTGSSLQSVDVDWDIWKKLTGSSSEKDATLRLEGPSWGKNIKLIGSPAAGELRVGRLAIPHPLVTTEPAKPNDYRDNHRGNGLLGNSLFFGDIVVLDLGVHPMFGLITP